MTFLVWVFGFLCGVGFVFLAAAFAVSGKESRKEEAREGED